MSDKAAVDTHDPQAQGPNIDSILNEQRKFDPPAEFSKLAHIKSLEEYERLYKESVDDPDKFWSRIASELHWFKKWDKVLEWNCPWAKWFVGGQINLSYNCLDRHVATWRKERRPRRHLHGHDARASGGHAGLRPHRRAAHHRLRRILF